MKFFTSLVSYILQIISYVTCYFFPHRYIFNNGIIQHGYYKITKKPRPEEDLKVLNSDFLTDEEYMTTRETVWHVTEITTIHQR